MTFKRRLILLVSGSTTFSVLLTAIVLAWHSRGELLEEAQAEAETVAVLLARGLDAAEHLANATEKARAAIHETGGRPDVSAERRAGAEFMVDTLLAAGSVNAIWLFDRGMNLVAGGHSADSQWPKPTETERATLREASRSGRIEAYVHGSSLTVAVPLPSENGSSPGTVLLRLPMSHVREMLLEGLVFTGLVAVLAALLGWLLALLLSERTTRPVLNLVQAAQQVEEGRLDAGLLQAQSGRKDELGRLSRTFTEMAEQVFARQEQLDALVRERTRELAEKKDELEAAHRLLQKELEVARSLQLSILPTDFPVHEAYDVYGNMTPATEMSGDFYDLFPIDDHRLGLVVADVSGKGVPAAFFMAVARTELHSIAQEGGAPGQVLARVNDALCDENPLHLFVTVFYAVLDIGSGRFQYANGGHNPPVRMRGTEVSALDTTGGMALGLFPGVAFRDTSLELAPGDGIFMYTDGVTEAFDTAGREFGEARLHQSLGEADLQDAEQLVRSVLTAVTEFASGARQSDDITCLAVRFLEPLANHDSA